MKAESGTLLTHQTHSGNIEPWAHLLEHHDALRTLGGLTGRYVIMRYHSQIITERIEASLRTGPHKRSLPLTLKHCIHGLPF